MRADAARGVTEKLRSPLTVDKCLAEALASIQHEVRETKNQFVAAGNE
jgi:hypothetical protein